MSRTRHPCRERRLKPSSFKRPTLLRLLRLIQTLKTLSEGEREKFLDFVTEQIKDFAQPINDVEAWLANKNKARQNRWEVYYSKFVSSSKPIARAAPVNPLTEQIMRRREEAMKRLTEERANQKGVQ